MTNMPTRFISITFNSPIPLHRQSFPEGWRCFTFISHRKRSIREHSDGHCKFQNKRFYDYHRKSGRYGSKCETGSHSHRPEDVCRINHPAHYYGAAGRAEGCDAA